MNTKQTVSCDWYVRRCTAEMALRWLAKERDNLRRAGARNAADAVARAMKSVDGARRHAAGRVSREGLLYGYGARA
jgi:hypothetical protein